MEQKGLPLTEIPGIGPARAKKLEKLGLRELADVLAHYPQRYEDRRDIYAIQRAPEGESCCVCAMVAETPTLSRIRKGLELVKVRAVDHTGTLHLTFFNQPYLKDKFPLGAEFRFYGRVETMGRRFAMSSPVYEYFDTQSPPPDLVPVYRMTEGLTGKQISANVAAALAAAAAVVAASGSAVGITADASVR